MEIQASITLGNVKKEKRSKDALQDASYQCGVRRSREGKEKDKIGKCDMKS